MTRLVTIVVRFWMEILSEGRASKAKPPPVLLAIIPTRPQTTPVPNAVGP